MERRTEEEGWRKGFSRVCATRLQLVVQKSSVGGDGQSFPHRESVVTCVGVLVVEMRNHFQGNQSPPLGRGGF
ncbi:hypothetical protein EYF80_053287 [Liparis tanakae]|uniref:Uncharacterized protein n=1 Tax=Liparis tanakae TaxID=230148 RepID=A0A4Z2F6R8_9TELE|nr:hypothetical protein EYF80_053287 [Liparis tanakae]